MRPVVFNIPNQYNGFMHKTSEITSFLIAPCGMNCGVCSAYLRERKPCPGCNGDDAKKSSTHCATCRIKNCENLKDITSGLCVDCSKFPCARIKHIDKRYQTKYGMSMIENLETIQSLGMNAFVKQERSRWQCSKCGGILCVHRNVCPSCGRKYKKKSYNLSPKVRRPHM